MAKTISELATDASNIKREETAGENTASRVGTMFLDIIDYLGTLNTSSGSEDEGGSGGGGGGGVSLNEPLSSINNMARTPSGENKVLVYQNGTWTYDDYGGGSTPTSGVTWTALAGNTTEQINVSHLTNALSSYLGNYRFWGQQPAYDATSGHMIVSGNMTDVGSITMKNGDYSVTIAVDANGDLKFDGNIYATGGVSALGNSSSGGGGGGGSVVSWNQIASGTKIATITIDGTTTDVYAPTSGGGGGATTLGGLNDVTLGSLSGGQYLRYDSNIGKWVNGQFSSLITTLNGITEGSNNVSYLLHYNGGWSLTRYEQSSSDISVSVVDTGNAVINAEVSNNVLTLTKGTVLTSLPVASSTTLGGIKVGSHLAIYDGVLSVNGTGLSVTSATNATNAAQADRLSGSTTYSAWGRIYWQGGQPKDIDGIMTGVSTIKMNYGSGPNYIEMPNNSSIKIAPAAGTTIWNNRTHVEAVLLNQGNQLSFGYGARLYNFQTDIQGGSSITFATSAVNGTGDSRRDVGGFTKAGQFYVEQGDQGIKIGNGIIKWDSTHDALYVVKDGGGVANFYASGGVSALGFSNGSTGSVTVADLTVTNQQYCYSLAVNSINTYNTDAVYFGDDGATYIDTEGNITVGTVLSTYIGAQNGYTYVSMLKLGTKASTYTPSGSGCSLYVKDKHLYFYNGTSASQIA